MTSDLTINYGNLDFVQIYDKEKLAVGPDVIAGLLHVHCGKKLKDLHVLDAGCGTGHYAKALIDLGVGKLTLLDSSSEMLTVATQKLKELLSNKIVHQVIKADLPPLPFEDGAFDAVMFNFVLQDFDRSGDGKNASELETVLLDTKRILRPRGVLVITTILPSVYEKAIWYNQLHPTVTEKNCQVFMPVEKYLELFHKCGFRCVSAINHLRRTDSTEIHNYLDANGPFKEHWRIGTFAFTFATDQEMKEIQEFLTKMKQEGTLQKFMKNHDRTSELGMLTLLVCISDH